MEGVAHPIRATAAVPLSELRLVSARDFRFAPSPWRLIGDGHVQVQDRREVVSLEIGRSFEEGGLLGHFTLYDSRPHTLNLLVSTDQWVVLVDARLRSKALALEVNLVASLDREETDHDMNGGELVCFSLAIGNGDTHSVPSNTK